MDYKKVKEALKIQDVIGQFIRIEEQKNPRDWRCKCPFHLGDDTPSFSINTVNQYFYCFGCKASGDVVQFVSKLQNFDINASLEYCAKLAGIEPEGHDLIDLIKSIDEFYKTNLEFGKNYLKGRQITRQQAIDFGIGFAPNNTNAFLHLFKDALPELAQLGYIKKKYEGTPNEVSYLHFYNRVTLPVHSSTYTIGFAARSIDGSEPKYLNSVDSSLFQRRRTLYGLNNFDKKDKNAFVVEGILDAVRMKIHGYKNTVASLGTAITPEQLGVLTRLGMTPWFLFDGDPAGDKATLTVAKMCLKYNINFNIVKMLEGEDPNSFLLKHDTLEDLIVLDAEEFVKTYIDREGFISLLEEMDDPFVLDTGWFEYYRVSPEQYQRKSRDSVLSYTKVTDFGPLNDLALFVLAFPQFAKELSPELDKATLEYSLRKEVLNLNYKNYFLQTPESKQKALFEELVSKVL